MDILFEHPLTNRNLSPAEKAFVRYVMESLRRVVPEFKGQWVVSISDFIDREQDAMLYRVKVRWDYGAEQLLAHKMASGEGVTPGDALTDMLAQLAHPDA